VRVSILLLTHLYVRFGILLRTQFM
jgi:hypothetical protein